MHDDDDENTGPGPAEFFGKFLWEICPRCRGEGKHVNPSIDGHGLSREDFDEDPDFAEDYFSGVYDVACFECGGPGKVKRPNWRAMTKEQKAAVAKHLQEEADDRAVSRMERGWDDQDPYRGRYGY